MDDKLYTEDLTSDEDEDWCLVSEAGSEDLDSAFQILSSNDLVTEQYFDHPHPLVENEEENKEEQVEEETTRKERITTEESNTEENDSWDFLGQEVKTKNSEKHCTEEKSLWFHENHYNFPDKASDVLFSEEEPFINLNTDSLEVAENDVESNLTKELVCIMEDEGLKERKIDAKVQEVDDFWQKYDYWDSNPSVQKIHRKHNRIYRRRKYMWKRNPPPFA